MDELVKFFQKMSEGITLLKEDIERASANHKNNIDKDGNKLPKEEEKLMPMKSMQPMTRLYSSKDEIVRAKENPDMGFINGKIKDIFGK